MLRNTLLDAYSNNVEKSVIISVMLLLIFFQTLEKLGKMTKHVRQTRSDIDCVLEHVVLFRQTTSFVKTSVGERAVKKSI